MEKKLLFFDIDGTLIDYHNGINDMPKDTITALDALRHQGHEVFLATGRCRCFVPKNILNYPWSGMVSCNGGYATFKHQAIVRYNATKEAINKVIDLCHQHHFLYYFENNDVIYVPDCSNERHKELAKNWGMDDDILIDDFDPNTIDCHVAMVIINHPEEKQILFDELSPYFDVQGHSAWYAFDLTLKDTSKAKGIEKLVKALGCSMEDTIAFGDGRNDIEMLQSAHIGIAMGNAVTEAKQAADYITSNIEDGGILNACLHFKLIDSQL